MNHFLASLFIFSTTIVQFVARAVNVPTAANIGAKTTPIAPIVRGNSIMVSSLSFLIIIRLAFTYLIISLTFDKISSPETLNDS